MSAASIDLLHAVMLSRRDDVGRGDEGAAAEDEDDGPGVVAAALLVR
jgi:hypothetical protein